MDIAELGNDIYSEAIYNFTIVKNERNTNY